MNKFGYLLATTALVGVASGTAIAASSKFAANVLDVTLVPVTDGFSPTEVLSIPIKTANKSDLLIGVSLETVLFTRTKVKGKKGGSETATAEGKVEVCVAVSGVAAGDIAPDCVTFDKRAQTLSATFGGVIESCEDTLTCSMGATSSGECTAGSDGKITVAVECIVTDEEIELILDTMSAHHFNYVARNLSSGNHTVSVTVDGTISESGSGDAEAKVGVGNGSLTVEQVRAVNDGTGIVF